LQLRSRLRIKTFPPLPARRRTRGPRSMALRSLLVVAGALVTRVVAQDETCDPKPPCTGPKSPHTFMAALMNPATYDVSKRPLCQGSGPTVVEVQFQVERLSDVNQKTALVSMAGLLRTWWRDPRLAFNGTSAGGCFDKVTLTGEQAQGRMWLPDIYIDNLVTKKVDSFSSSVEVKADGSVMRTEQMIMEVKTTLNLGKLPYDSHVATILLASYSQDISRLRLMPRGGTVGPGTGGIGLIADPLAQTNVMWTLFPDSLDNMQSAGSAEILFGGSWDYVTLSLPFKRKPRFMENQVYMPSLLFAAVSYVQFWVDPAQAPARAALAVIPVLIMLTLSSSVYRSLPEGSQEMWLSNHLMALTFLCSLSALQFVFLQIFSMHEAKCSAKVEGLKRIGEEAQKLLKKGDEKGTKLSDLLKRYEPVPGEQEGRMKTSAALVEDGVKESDFVYVSYVNLVCNKYDADDNGTMHVIEMQRAFKYFGIYLGKGQIATTACQFMRDNGHATPAEELNVVLTTLQFCRLLTSMGKYALRPPPKTFSGFFASSPPSKLCDFFARAFIPLFIFVQQVTLHVRLPAY